MSTRTHSFALRLTLRQAAELVTVLARVPSSAKTEQAVAAGLRGLRRGIKKALDNPRCRHCKHLEKRHGKDGCSAEYSSGPSGNHRCSCPGFEREVEGG